MGFSSLREALTTPQTHWTPEQAYRWVVIPLAAMSIIVGVGFIFGFGVFDIHPNRPLPFVESHTANRWSYASIGAFVLAMGVGLGIRSRAAWYAFFAYLLVGTLYQILGRILDPISNDIPWAFVPLVVAFNGAFGFAVFVATHKVFERRSIVPQGDSCQP